jgi:O-antigen/teichoic acid export membrane protein
VHFLQILKKSSRLTVINGLGALLNFLAASYAANWLGPDTYGRVSFVLLWVSYAGLVRPGFFEGGQRQLIDLAGKGEIQESYRVQNIGLSAEMLWIAFPSILLGAVSAGLPDPVRQTGFMLAPFLFAGQAMTRMFGGLFLAHQRFGEYTAAFAVRAFAQPALLIGLLHLAGPPALLVAPALTEWATALFYFWRAPGIGVKWLPDRRAAMELMKAGLPLSLANIAYWVYRLAGPTTIATALPAAALGSYTFASKIIDQITRFFGDFGNVLMPGLWTNLGRAGSTRTLLTDISRINTWLVLISCLVCNLIQASAGTSVAAFLPRFASSAPILEVLAFNTVLLTITMTPGLLLDSAVINKQRLHVGIWAGGAALNYAANYTVLAAGHGIGAVAWNDIWMQVLVDGAIYAALHRHLFGSRAEARCIYIPLALLVGCCAALFLTLRAPFLSTEGLHGFWQQLRMFSFRNGLVIAVWAAITFYFQKLHPFGLEDAKVRQAPEYA